MKKRFVVGFMFEEGGPKVLLIRKKRPQWQVGMLNGVGGKIEERDVSPEHAMVREFFEETTIATSILDWRCFCMLEDHDSIVYMFTSQGPIALARKREDEYPVMVMANQLHLEDVVPNLLWLVPMARATYQVTAYVFEHGSKA